MFNAYAICWYKNCKLTLTSYHCKLIKVILALLMNKRRRNSATSRKLVSQLFWNRQIYHNIPITLCTNIYKRKLVDSASCHLFFS